MGAGDGECGCVPFEERGGVSVHDLIASLLFLVSSTTIHRLWLRCLPSKSSRRRAAAAICRASRRRAGCVLLRVFWTADRRRIHRIRAQSSNAPTRRTTTILQQDPGRLDVDIKLLLPPCNDTGHSYSLRLPFAFSRLGGAVVWPPDEVGVYLNDAPAVRNEGSSRTFPAWDFDPPVEPGATLRLCWNVTGATEGEPIELHNSLSFT